MTEGLNFNLCVTYTHDETGIMMKISDPTPSTSRWSVEAKLHPKIDGSRKIRVAIRTLIKWVFLVVDQNC